MTPRNHVLDFSLYARSGARKYLNEEERRRVFAATKTLPPERALMSALDQRFSLRNAQQDDARARARLWPFCRETAWRIIKTIMTAARIRGSPACPRGLRHAFGVAAVQARIPLNVLQRWLGHARMTTTAIYADVTGPEELALAERLWRSGQQHR